MPSSRGNKIDKINKYEINTDQGPADAAAHVPSRCCMHSTGGSTFLHEITSWSPTWKCGDKSKIRCHQSM